MACIALRQLGDEIMAVRSPGSGLDFGIGGFRTTVGNVVAHISGEQCRLLRHHGSLLPQLRQADVAHIVAVEQYGALLRIIKTL